MEFNAKTADGSTIPEAVADVFQCTLTLSVENAALLWDSAADIFMASGDEVTLDDIVDTIGPREDPNIADCLTTVMTGIVPQGCAVNDIYLMNNALASDWKSAETSSGHDALLDVVQPIEVPEHYSHVLPAAGGALSLHCAIGGYHAPS